MVTRPPNRRLGGRHPQLLGYRPDHVQRAKVRIVPVPPAKIRALHPLRIKPTALLVFGGVALVPIRKHPAGYGTELVKGDTVVSQTREQLRLDRAL